MPPLSRAETDQLIATLTALREELGALLEHTRDDARPVDLDLPIGRLSRMDAIQQQQMSRAGRAQYQRRLAQVEAALDSHRDGAYGDCRNCGEPVGFARLSARPESPFCIACQEALEAEK